MKLVNAKHICDKAAEKGFGVPALNNNGGNYDIGRAIIESAQELDSPLIIQCYEPNLEYCGYDYAGLLIKFLAADTTIPISIALDHGKTPQSVFRAARAGFNHVMIDYADKPLEENARGTQEIINLVRPLGISVEAEIGHIIKSSDDSKARAPKVSVEEAVEFTSKVTSICWRWPTAARTAFSRCRRGWISNWFPKSTPLSRLRWSSTAPAAFPWRTFPRWSRPA